jgi:hypothetical protein
VCFPSGLSDGFDGPTVDTSLWAESADAGVTIGIDAGVVYFEPPPNGVTGVSGRLQTHQTYDFTGCGTWIELAGTFNSGVVGYALLEMRADEQNEAEIMANTDGDLVFVIETASTIAPGAPQVAFDPSVHRWLRIREQSGTLYQETSTDGVDWSVHFSYATPPWITAAYIRFGMRAESTTSAPGRAELDNVNLTP